MNRNYDEFMQLRRKKLKIIFMCLKIKYNFKSRMKKYGGLYSLNKILENRLRQVLSFQSVFKI